MWVDDDKKIVLVESCFRFLRINSIVSPNNVTEKIISEI